MITTLLFDINNVVWFHQAFQKRLFQRWSEISHLSYDNFYDKYVSFYKFLETNEKTLDDLVVYLNQSDPSLYWQALTDIYHHPSFDHYLNQPLLNLITRLRAIIKVGYLSNAENFYYEYIHQKVESYFDFGYSSWQLKIDKPNPQIYLKTLELQHLKPEEVIFIDDTPKNIASAESLGIKSILFVDNQSLLSSLSGLTLFSK